MSLIRISITRNRVISEETRLFIAASFPSSLYFTFVPTGRPSFTPDAFLTVRACFVECDINC